MPYKDREARRAYARCYYQEHREGWNDRQDTEAINDRRRERYRRSREGLPNKRTTHGLTGTTLYALWAGAKKRAQTRGLPFNLEPHDVPVIPERCPVLDIVICPGDGRMVNSSPTLDRIVPSLGYVVGNVRVTSWRASRLRSDGMAEELRKIADDAARIAAAVEDMEASE